MSRVAQPRLGHQFPGGPFSAQAVHHRPPHTMSNTIAFAEDHLSKHADPLAITHADFDFAEVERALGEIEPEGQSEEFRKKLAQALGLMLRHICATQVNTDCDRVIGRRAIGLAWVVRPDIFGGCSLASIARKLRIKPRTLQSRSAQASAYFGVVNRGQSHGWNRTKKSPQAHLNAPG